MIDKRKEMAISSMAKIEQSGAFYRLDYKGLSHGIPRMLSVAEEYKGYKPIWNPWQLIGQPDKLIILNEWATNEVKINNWEFDLICGISTTGISLGTILSVTLTKRLMMSDNKTFINIPSRPNKGERILLLDSLLVTGFHLYNNIEKIKQCNAYFTGMITITIDDLIKDRLPIVDTLLKENNIRYYFKTSELYNWWKEEFDNIEIFNPLNW
jgi:hypothetical protein